MKKVAAIVRLMSMPISSVASWSCAVARMAFPSVERLTKIESTIIRTTAITITKMSLRWTVASAIVKLGAGTSGS